MAIGDLDAYLRIADEFDARHVLDVDCGTGPLAIQRFHRDTNSSAYRS